MPVKELKDDEKKIIFLTGYEDIEDVFYQYEQSDISVVVIDYETYFSWEENGFWPEGDGAPVIFTSDVKPSDDFIERHAQIMKREDIHSLLLRMKGNDPVIGAPDIQNEDLIIQREIPAFVGHKVEGDLLVESLASAVQSFDQKPSDDSIEQPTQTVKGNFPVVCFPETENGVLVPPEKISLSIDDEIIDDFLAVPLMKGVLKVNFLADFRILQEFSKVHGGLLIGKHKKSLSADFFNQSQPFHSVSSGSVYVNVINQDALTNRQKQSLDSNHFTLEIAKEWLEAGPLRVPSTFGADWAVKNKIKSGKVDAIHILGEFGNASVHVGDQTSKLITSQDFPFKVVDNDLGFHFWGADTDAYEQHTQREKRRALVSKTYNIDPVAVTIDTVVMINAAYHRAVIYDPESKPEEIGVKDLLSILRSKDDFIISIER